MSESVTREVVLPLERDEAWRVVTEPDHLREWLADDVEIDLVEGGLIELGWDGGGRRHGIVETVEEHEPASPSSRRASRRSRPTWRRAAPPSAAGPGTCDWERVATCR